MTTIEMVREFQKAFGLDWEPGPRLPSARTRLVRQHLMYEETSEFIHAALSGDLIEMLDGLTDMQYILDGTAISCGMLPEVNGVRPSGRSTPVVPSPEKLDHHISILLHNLGYLHLGMGLKGQEKEVQGWLDQCQFQLDTIYDVCGMLGIKQVAFAEVHRSNMSKLVDGKPTKDGSGRVLKGPDYSRPNLAQFIGA